MIMNTSTLKDNIQVIIWYWHGRTGSREKKATTGIIPQD